MNKNALECYLMIGSKEPVIEWLKEEGVTTRDEAGRKLNGLLSGIALATFTSGAPNSSTFDSSNRLVSKILESFE